MNSVKKQTFIESLPYAKSVLVILKIHIYFPLIFIKTLKGIGMKTSSLSSLGAEIQNGSGSNFSTHILNIFQMIFRF